MEYLIRFIAGGAMIVLLSYIAENKSPFLAGVLAMFPIMFVTTLFLVGSSSGMDVARSLAGSMVVSMPILLIFCGVFYVASMRFALYPTVAISITAWLIAACGYIFIAKHFASN